VTAFESRSAGRVRQGRTSAGRAPKPGLARDLSELARELHAETDPVLVLQRVVDAALSKIGSAVAAGITMVDRGCYRTAAQTSEVLAEIDQVQYRTNDGPCVTSLREQMTVRSDDLTSETRWPEYAEAAVEKGLHSLVSFQLFVEDHNLGALNVYADKPNVFDDDAEEAGLLLASHAAVAISGRSKETNLRNALVSRDVIGQAKGILMERFRLSAGEAFELLARASQREHRKLRDFADDLASTGDLPGWLTPLDRSGMRSTSMAKAASTRSTQRSRSTPPKHGGQGDR
jgi:GAF domain-containing protein